MYLMDTVMGRVIVFDNLDPLVVGYKKSICCLLSDYKKQKKYYVFVMLGCALRKHLRHKIY